MEAQVGAGLDLLFQTPFALLQPLQLSLHQSVKHSPIPFGTDRNEIRLHLLLHTMWSASWVNRTRWNSISELEWTFFQKQQWPLVLLEGESFQFYRVLSFFVGKGFYRVLAKPFCLVWKTFNRWRQHGKAFSFTSKCITQGPVVSCPPIRPPGSAAVAVALAAVVDSVSDDDNNSNNKKRR